MKGIRDCHEEKTLGEMIQDTCNPTKKPSETGTPPPGSSTIMGCKRKHPDAGGSRDHRNVPIVNVNDFMPPVDYSEVDPKDEIWDLIIRQDEEVEEWKRRKRRNEKQHREHQEWLQRQTQKVPLDNSLGELVEDTQSGDVTIKLRSLDVQPLVEEVKSYMK